MAGRGAFLRVGLLIVGATGLLFGLLLFLGGNKYRNGVPFESYFTESVQGLEVGAPVKFRGVGLGRVTEIGLVSAEYSEGMPIDTMRASYRLVYVRWVIDPSRLGSLPDTAEAVKSGLRAKVASQGLTGLSYIELDFVDPKNFPVPEIPWKPRYPIIPSIPSTLTQVQDAAQQLLAKLNSVDIEGLLRSLTGLVDDARSDLGSGDLHNAIGQASELIKSTKKLVEDANVPALSAELRSLAIDARATSEALRAVAQGKDTKAILANTAAATAQFSAASAKLAPLLVQLQATATRADNGAADLQQSLIPILRDMQATATNLRQTTEVLRQYPASTLLGGPPPRAQGGSR